MVTAHVHDHSGVDPVGAILLLIDAAVLIFVVLLLALRPGPRMPPRPDLRDIVRSAPSEEEEEETAGDGS
jgi:hypothetical protein